MWALDNQTAYAADSQWTRDRQGVRHWLVAVKATFDIATTGRLTLADVQPPPVLAPEYHGDPGRSSLRADSDLLAIKPCTDLLLDAHAHAPGHRRTGRVPISVRAGTVKKTLLVHGDRVYFKAATGGLTTSSPQPFETRPIRYERAFGGSAASPEGPVCDPRNPIGVGFALDPAKLIHQPAPSVEYPHGDAAKNGPAGLGPIDAAWSPRRELAGTYDATWERTKKPLLPDDYNPLYASCAPADQRVAEHLHGGTRVELVNLTPEGALQFELPRIYLTFTTCFGQRRQEHRSRMTSVQIACVERKLMLVWQSTLEVDAADDEYLDQTIIREKPYLT